MPSCFHYRLAPFRGWLCVVYVLAAVAAAPARASDTPMQHLLKEAPAGWRHVRRTLETLEGEVTHTYDIRLPGRAESARKGSEFYAFAFLAPNGLVRRELLDHRDLMCRNSDYSFKLRKMDPDSSWSLRDVSDLGGTSAAEFRSLTQPMYAPISVFEEPLESLLTSESLEAVEEQTSEAGDTSVKARFRRTAPLPANGDYVLGGDVELLPSAHWIVRRYEVQFSATGNSPQAPRTVGTITGTIEYGGMIDGCSLPDRYFETSDFSESGAASGESSYAFRRWRRCSLSTNDFTLTAYGIAEPAQGPSRISLLMAINVVAALLIGAAWWLRSRARQSKPSGN